MKKRFTTLLLSCLTVMSANSFAEQIVHLQNHRLQESIIYSNAYNFLIKPLNEKLAGRYKFVLHEQSPKSSLSSNKATFPAVKNGSIDGLIMTPLYWGKYDKIFGVIGDLTAAWPSPFIFLEWYNKEGESHLRKAYQKHNMHLVNVSISSAESLVSTSPIRSLDDFKGKIIRTLPGNMSSAYFKHLGAIPREIDISKVPKALARQHVDIADFTTIAGNEKENIYQHAKHTNYPGFHSMPVHDFAFNTQVWNKFPNDVKRIIEEQAKVWQQAGPRHFINVEKEAIKRLKEDGVHIYTWEESELKKARIESSKLWDEYAKDSKSAQNALSSIRTFLESKGYL